MENEHSKHKYVSSSLSRLYEKRSWRLADGLVAMMKAVDRHSIASS